MKNTEPTLIIEFVVVQCTKTFKIKIDNIKLALKQCFAPLLSFKS